MFYVRLEECQRTLANPFIEYVYDFKKKDLKIISLIVPVSPISTKLQSIRLLLGRQGISIIKIISTLSYAFVFHNSSLLYHTGEIT
jgi:hypothetical protein